MPADIPITPEMVEAALDAQRGHRGWRYNEADAKRREMRAALSAALAASALPQAVAALEALMTPSQWPGDAVDAARAALAALREAGWSVAREASRPLTAAELYPGHYKPGCTECAGMGCSACVILPPPPEPRDD